MFVKSLLSVRGLNFLRTDVAGGGVKCKFDINVYFGRFAS